MGPFRCSIWYNAVGLASSRPRLLAASWLRLDAQAGPEIRGDTYLARCGDVPRRSSELMILLQAVRAVRSSRRDFRDYAAACIEPFCLSNRFKDDFEPDFTSPRPHGAVCR